MSKSVQIWLAFWANVSQEHIKDVINIYLLSTYYISISVIFISNLNFLFTQTKNRIFLSLFFFFLLFFFFFFENVNFSWYNLSQLMYSSCVSAY